MTGAAIVTLGLIGTFAKLKAASGGVPTGLAVMLSIFGLAGLGLAYAGIKGLIGLARHGSWTLECVTAAACSAKRFRSASCRQRP
jgi:hypothetical protein